MNVNSNLPLSHPVVDAAQHTSADTGQANLKSSEEKLLGIDVSHYQGDVDWKSVKKAGIKFVYLKGTEGMHTTDPKFLKNAAELDKLNIPYGVYHFFEPKEKGFKQANHYLDKVTVSGRLPPVIDIETSSSVKDAQIKVEAKQWLSEVEVKTGCKPIIFTYKSYWETKLGDDFKDYELWLADYDGQATLPKGISKWLFWQHSSKGKVRGIDGYVDLDYFSGGTEELESYKCK